MTLDRSLLSAFIADCYLLKMFFGLKVRNIFLYTIKNCEFQLKITLANRKIFVLCTIFSPEHFINFISL